MEPLVGSLRRALAREHAGRVLALTLEREDARGEGEVAGQVLQQRVAEPLTGVLAPGQRHARHLGAGERLARQRLANVATADGVDEVVARVLLGDGVPVLQDGAGAGVEAAPPVGRHLPEAGGEGVAVLGVPGLDLRLGADGLPPLAGRGHLHLGPVAVGAAGVGDLGEVALPRGRDDGQLGRVQLGQRLGVEQRRGPVEAVGAELVEEGQVERRDAGVVELRRHRRIDRHVGGRRRELAPVALDLLLDVPQGVLRAALLELVERHEVGHVQHPDLLQLRRRAEVGGHHVE